LLHANPCPILAEGATLCRTCLLGIYAKPFPFFYFIAAEFEIGAGVHLWPNFVVDCCFGFVFELMVYLADGDETAIFLFSLLACPLTLIADGAVIHP
jgi:hypothetical protein